MGVGAKGREWKSADLRDEGEGVDLDVGIDVFATEEAGKEIVVASEADVTTELDGVAMIGDADGVGDVESMFACAPRKDAGAAESADEVSDLGLRISGVCV